MLVTVRLVEEQSSRRDARFVANCDSETGASRRDAMLVRAVK